MDVDFAIDSTGFNWHPFGLGDFGADFTGSLQVASSGFYNFSMKSDDGSLLFIDHQKVVDDGGLHGPGGPEVVSVNLSAGVHSFEVEFFENGIGASGLDLNLPSGVTFAGSSSTGPSLGYLTTSEWTINQPGFSGTIPISGALTQVLPSSVPCRAGKADKATTAIAA